MLAPPSNSAKPQSLSRVPIHTVFPTKSRAPFLRDPMFRDEIFSYLGGYAKTLGYQPIRIGGTEDHVHLLTTLSRTLAIADFITGIVPSPSFSIGGDLA